MSTFEFARRAGALTLCALTLTACGGGGGGGGGSANVDTTAPTVVSVTPATDATGVAVNTTVSVTFSEAVDCATLTTASFTLTGGSNAVNGSVTCDGANATFTPAANLAYSTAYTATVTTAATDSAGNGLAANYSWGFTTLIAHTVGGTANGLTATVVLQNNGGDNLSVNADGNFTFATPVTDGGAYSVTILTQPDSQTCTVSNGSGTATAPVSNVAVNCAAKAWGTAQPVETSDLGNATLPQVATDAAGNALAVWQHSEGGIISIMANRYVAGAGWGTAELIEADDVNDGLEPHVAMDAEGNGFAVWEHWDGTRTNILANRYSVGTGWGTAVVISDQMNETTGARIAFDTDGNALAVWQQTNGSRYSIWANRYSAGTGWGTAEVIETDDTGHANLPEVAFDAGGNALVVWQQYDGARINILSNRYSVGSGWGAAEVISDNLTEATNAKIAVDAAGNALAVWQQFDGANINILANRYAAGAGWGTAGLIETENLGPAAKAQVAMDANGNGLAVWEQSDGTRYNIWSNRYTAGTGWETAELVETDNVSHAIGARIVMDSYGNGLAVWQQSDGARYNLTAGRYTAGTGWGPTALIETNDAGGAQNAQIAINADGNAVVVWQYYDGARENVWGNRFE